MPTYEYVHVVDIDRGESACPEVRDVIQSINDAALTQCPDCGGDIQRQIAGCTFTFKGGAPTAKNF
jgi:putative FmdB family regulatory protein